MAIKQTIWSLEKGKELSPSKLISENELEELLAKNIELLSDDWLLVGRQVRTTYGGIIDLLCIDIAGNPIIIELKKGLTPREVTAQALDYASWVQEIDADAMAQIFLKCNKGDKSLDDAFTERFGIKLDDHEDTSEQIVIVATDMDGSTERIINYLQKYNVNINVLFFNVFEHEGKRLISRAWMFETDQANSGSVSSVRNWNGEYYFSYGADTERSWEDAMKYGFVSAGGGSWYISTLKKLESGNRIWVNIPHEGYVGVGVVTEGAKVASECSFVIDGKDTPFFDLPLEANYHREAIPEKAEYLVKIQWQKIVSRKSAVSEYGFFGNQHTVCRPTADKWIFTISRLKELWKIEN